MIDDRQAPIMLIFPPLIESNFGKFFPSTAVLTAFLEEHGIPCVQEDLNEEFAVHLLSEDMLTRLGAGDLPGELRSSKVAATARWAAKNRNRLIDEHGQHLFGGEQLGAPSEITAAMVMLARPFTLDPNAEVLTRLNTGAHPLHVFEEFYESSGIAQRVPEDTPLIGISVPMGPQLEPALLLAAHLRRHLPNAPIVLGGPTMSLMTLADLDVLLCHHDSVDCVVRFDGEFPLLELARRATAGRFSADGVSGVSYRRDGVVHHEQPTPGPNLDTLPVPAYPVTALRRLSDSALSVIQARGCYWGKCDYCDFVKLFNGSRPFRGRYPKNFVDEIELLIRTTGRTRFRFITESIPPAFARRMSELIIERGLQISWNSFAMVDHRFDRDLLKLMVDSGCECLVIGMETMNTRVLNLVHKSADREENLRFLRDARETGMRLVINLIPDLPSTTYAEALESLNDVQSMSDCMAAVNVFPFEPTRSSNIGRFPSRYGLMPIMTGSASGNAQAQYGLNHLDSVDPAMTSEERADIHRRYRAFSEKISRRLLPRDLVASILFSQDAPPWVLKVS